MLFGGEQAALSFDEPSTSSGIHALMQVIVFLMLTLS